ncbi:MAG: galactose-1-phosphate uridylyltransferase [Candidatus Omnitrophica bacterium]|nr:galactose-1-phosphate uridylyltransferase [Candidatus Omnitrophota bacterium]
MNELRREPVTGRWIVTYLDRIPAVKDFMIESNEKKGQATCPFCWGKEKETPPEILVNRKYGPPNSPNWTLRVVSNKFPALRIEGDLNKEGIGVFDMMNGIGAHEVIIETPDHFKDTADLTYQEAEEVIWAYMARSIDLRRDKRFKYILIFKNYGKIAGASLEHCHSQLIALPIVPKRVHEELEGAAAYYNYKERCVFCDLIREEQDERERVIYEDERVIGFCPYVSRFPYEIWIMPKKHMSDLTILDRDTVPSVAKALRDCLLRVKKYLGDPAYNFIVHTSPINGHEREDYHWHIEIMPKLVKVAGFEWGSGFYINPVPPDMAAKNLLSVKLEGK